MVAPRSDYAHHSPGLAALTAIGEELVDVTACADSQVKNLSLTDAGCVDLEAEGYRQVQHVFPWVGRDGSGQIRPRKLLLVELHDLPSYLKATATYSGADRNQDGRGVASAGLSHCQHRPRNYPGQNTPPARVNRGHSCRPGVGDQYRETVRNLDCHRDAAEGRNQGVALSTPVPLFGIILYDVDSVGVDLRESREAGAGQADRREEPQPILLHALLCVPSNTAQIEPTGLRANTADTRRESMAQMRYRFEGPADIECYPVCFAPRKPVELHGPNTVPQACFLSIHFGSCL